MKARWLTGYFLTSLAAAATFAAPVIPAATAYNNPTKLDLVQWLAAGVPKARIAYDTSSPVQFGDLWLPSHPAPATGFPLVILIHGGAMLADYDLDHLGPLAERLTQSGYAVWSIEYRRLGNTGGGFPGTFQDVAKAVDKVGALGRKYSLDPNRVVVVGHSSGGLLALWVAQRHNLKPDSPLYSETTTKLRGAIALDPITDLRSSIVDNHRDYLAKFLADPHGSNLDAVYMQTSPINLLPMRIPTVIIASTKNFSGVTGDAEWRLAMNRRFVASADNVRDNISIIELSGANHFDLVDAKSPAMAAVFSSIANIIGPGAKASRTSGRRGTVNAIVPGG